MFLLCHVIMAQDYVGTTAGVFSTSPTGAATYTIPLQLRDGYSAFTPQISLVYNSQSGNGIAGFGWNIAGLSAITAIPHSRYYDGTNIQGISVNSSDVYALDGERLLLKSGANAKKGAEYTTEEEKYLKISIDSAFATTPKSFVVKKPDGSIYKYGSTTNSIYRYNGTSGTSAFAWLLDYAEDKDGNCIKYIYTYYNDVPYLTQIQYGINKSACSSYCSVTFNYAARTDTIVSHVKEKNFYTTRRLTNIVCKYYDTRYRTYGLSYNNTSHYSHLTAVKEVGSSTKGYPATTFTWKDLPTIDMVMKQTTVSNIINFPHNNYLYFVGDVDNDGKTDLLGLYPRSSGYSKVTVWKMSSDYNLVSQNTYNVSSCFEDDKRDIKSLLNGGIVAHFRQSQENTIVIPSISRNIDGEYFVHFSFPKENAGCNTQLKYTTEMPSYAIADFDKDGLDAIVFIEKKALTDKKLYLTTIRITLGGASQQQFNEQTLSLSSLNTSQCQDKVKRCLATDFNGDGLTDLLLLCENYSIMLWNVNGGFNQNNYQLLTNIKYADTMQLADFNADGLPDLLINDVSSTIWKKAINTGEKNANIFNISTISELTTRNIQKHGDEDSLYFCNVVDMNGDGLSDMVIGYNKNNTPRACWAQANHGGTFSVIKDIPMSNQSYSTLAHHVVSGDFNGDGQMDIINYGSNLLTGVSNGGRKWGLYANKEMSAASGRITCITDGIGKKTNITYRSLLKNYSNTKSVQFPLVKFYSSLIVVDSSELSWKDKSYTTQYQYADGVYHVEGKGFLGFLELTQKNDGLNSIVKRDLNTTYKDPYLTEKRVVDSMGNMAYNRIYRYSYNNGSVGKTFVKHLTYESEKDISNNQETESTYSNFHHSAPCKIVSGKTTKHTSTISYSDITSNGKWILDLPTTIVTEKECKGYDNITDLFYEKKNYFYDDKGRVTTHREYKSTVSSAYNLTNTQLYQYSSSGNIISSKTVAYDSTDTLTTTNTYDTKGRITRSVAPDGHATTYTYKTVGLMATENDEWFAKKTSYNYDGMGRLSQSICKSTADVFTPDTTAISYSLTDGNLYAYQVKTTHSTQPATTTYFDGFDRPTASGTIHFDGKEYITTKEYGTMTLVSKESVPHIKGSSAAAYTMYEYDTFHRPIQVTDPNGKVTETAYDERFMEVTANGFTTEYYYNYDGKLTNRYDDKGEINYFYKATGEYDKIQLCYQDEPDVFSTYTYDQYGRLTQLVDPNGDTRGYTYDDNGFLQKFSQGGNRWEKFTYNKYGDVTKKIYRLPNLSQITTNYTYDDKRQLVKILGPNFREEHTYNVSGQLTNKLRSVSVEGKTYRKSTDYAYNGESQVKSMTSTLNGVSFPVVESYNYKRGWTTDIKLNNRQVWHLNSENGQGLISSTSNRLGTTTYTYYNSGLIQNSNTTVFASSTGGNTSFQHSYTYDEYGRIATKDGKQYGYDDYNQLTSWNGRGYSYDQRGNIIMAGGQTELIYQQYKINTIVVPNVNIWGRGNLNITYNGLNKPHTIKLQENNSNVGYETEIRYDAEGNRISAVKTRSVTQGTAITTTNEYVRAYVDSRYEVEDKITDSSSPYQPTRYYYVGGDPLSACAVAAICNNQLTLWQIYHDNQGSITEMADSVNVNRYYYDPWGRYCDASGNMSSIYGKGGNAGNPFYRGFLGQEHDLKYGVINLNARLYDPFIGRFLSADPVYDSSRSIFGFNPYIYGNNCPSMYADPDGDFPWIIVGAALIGGGINLYANRDHVENFWQGLSYFGVGAAGGGAAMAFPEAAFWINGGVTMANSALSQGFADGWDTINWGHVAFEGIVSMGIERFTGPLQQNISNWIGGYTSRLTHSTLFNRWINKIFASTTTNGMIEGALSVVEKKPILKGVKHGVEKGFYKGTIQWAISDLPMQKHHFATNKHSEFTPAMENIAKKYGLNLDDDWNIAVMPHLGRHPSSYNNWVLNRMRLIDKMPGMNQQRFLEEFDIRIKQPIIDNPEMLRKAWW